MTMPKTLELETHSANETLRLGRRLSESAAEGDIVLLTGDLGAGKTQFVKGVAVGLGIDQPILSPTFVLFREYRGRIDLFHMDLYRGDESTYLETGASDVAGAQGLMVIEWGDRVLDLFERSRLDFLTVEIDKGPGPDDRRILATPSGRRSSELLREWVATC